MSSNSPKIYLPSQTEPAIPLSVQPISRRKQLPSQTIRNSAFGISPKPTGVQRKLKKLRNSASKFGLGFAHKPTPKPANLKKQTTEEPRTQANQPKKKPEPNLKKQTTEQPRTQANQPKEKPEPKPKPNFKNPRGPRRPESQQNDGFRLGAGAKVKLSNEAKRRRRKQVEGARRPSGLHNTTNHPLQNLYGESNKEKPEFYQMDPNYSKWLNLNQKVTEFLAELNENHFKISNLNEKENKKDNLNQRATELLAEFKAWNQRNSNQGPASYGIEMTEQPTLATAATKANEAVRATANLTAKEQNLARTTISRHVQRRKEAALKKQVTEFFAALDAMQKERARDSNVDQYNGDQDNVDMKALDLLTQIQEASTGVDTDAILTKQIQSEVDAMKRTLGRENVAVPVPPKGKPPSLNTLKRMQELDSRGQFTHPNLKPNPNNTQQRLRGPIRQAPRHRRVHRFGPIKRSNSELTNQTAEKEAKKAQKNQVTETTGQARIAEQAARQENTKSLKQEKPKRVTHQNTPTYRGGFPYGTQDRSTPFPTVVNFRPQQKSSIVQAIKRGSGQSGRRFLPGLRMMRKINPKATNNGNKAQLLPSQQLTKKTRNRVLGSEQKKPLLQLPGSVQFPKNPASRKLKHRRARIAPAGNNKVKLLAATPNQQSTKKTTRNQVLGSKRKLKNRRARIKVKRGSERRMSNKVPLLAENKRNQEVRTNQGTNKVTNQGTNKVTNQGTTQGTNQVGINQVSLETNTLLGGGQKQTPLFGPPLPRNPRFVSKSKPPARTKPSQSNFFNLRAAGAASAPFRLGKTIFGEIASSLQQK